MDLVQQLAAPTDRLLICCLCQHLLCEAVQLKCLHNCCRKCFRAAASKAGSKGVRCSACGVRTKNVCQEPNGFVDGQVQRYRAIAESKMRGVCKGNGEHDKPALVWCAACRHSLCGDCIPAHRQYNRQHATQSLEELSSLAEVCSQPSTAACAIHKKPLEMACRNCEQAKCISCWAECHEKNHETHVVGKESFDIYIGKFIANIAFMESQLIQKSEVLHKFKSIRRDTKAARIRHLGEIGERKRRVMDTVEMVYKEIELSTKNIYDDMEAHGHAASKVAHRINSDLADARDYIRRLVDSNEKFEILKQQRVVQERLSALSAELDSFSERLTTTVREVKIEASLPDDVENIVRNWIGTPLVNESLWSPRATQQQRQILHFGSTSDSSYKLPVQCVDVSLTYDGCNLLLAAQEHGLIELSSASGRELSRWRPPKLSSSERVDRVHAVVALKDGRVAVSLPGAWLVILRRTEKSGSSKAGDDAWTEDNRLQLQRTTLSCWLSAHDDVLAAASGQRLQLMSLSSLRRLSATELQREYEIGSLAVASRTVVTGSYRTVKLGSGLQPMHVLDAHSLDSGSDKRLWRKVWNSDIEQQEKQEELLWCLSADSLGGCLYAAVCRSDKSSGRVCTLSLADGSMLNDFALDSFSAATRGAALQPLLLPRRLSLCDDREASQQQQQQQHNSSSSTSHQVLLAVLCLDPHTFENTTVKLLRS